ncbi:MAG: AAA family ATPase [Planctomycetota bacterium]
MIRLIEALNFRCLRYVRQPLGPFHILVGPNASGKTTFLDVVAFLGRMVSDGLEAAVGERTKNFYDLVWGREGQGFELAIEVAIPEKLPSRLRKRDFDTIRYEVRFGILPETGEVAILEENVRLMAWENEKSSQRAAFPANGSILKTPPAKRKLGMLEILSRGVDGRLRVTVAGEEKQVSHFFVKRRGKSALTYFALDDELFPELCWLKTTLTEEIQSLVLNSLSIRNPSPPGQNGSFKPDGSNLPWVVENLRKKSPKQFKDWLRHIQSELPDIEDIKTIEKPEDRHRYLWVCYRGGLKVPAWMVSDGTLRLLALTLLAYLPDLSGVCLIEEPENGIHPGAIETAYMSLSSVYDAQILLATHSPVIVSLAEADKVLCFKKTESGATDIVLGSEHPELSDWKGEPNLSVLFASGVLG